MKKLQGAVDPMTLGFVIALLGTTLAITAHPPKDMTTTSANSNYGHSQVAEKSMEAIDITHSDIDYDLSMTF